MKKTPVILTLGILITLALTYFIYQTYFKVKATSIWNVIPSQAVFVYEAGECKDCFTKGSESTAGRLFYQLLSNEQDSSRRIVDFLLTAVRSGMISAHVTNKESFDFVFYLPISAIEQKDKLLSSWRNIRGVIYSERKLNDISISEFRFGSRKLSCTEIDGVFVCSFTPFLVEDVIRTFNASSESGFLKNISDVYSLPRIKNDLGNVYIQLRNLPGWFGVFNSNGSMGFPILGKASLLDIKVDNTSFVLNGFSLSEVDTNLDLLSYFKEQSPVQFHSKNYIPNNTLMAVTYGISDGISFYNQLPISKEKTFQDSVKNLVKSDLASLFSTLGGEITVCFQEEKGDFSKIVMTETSNINGWLSFLNSLSSSVEKDDTVFYEQYSDYVIREVELKNLPGKLFRPLLEGFNQTYYTSIGNTLILSEELEQLKRFVDDIDAEEVWGKSVAVNKFIESTLLESNVGVYINTPLVWNVLIPKLNPIWSTFIQNNQAQVNTLGWGAIQFSHLNESFYTNINFTYSGNDAIEKSQKKERLVTNLLSAIITEPFVLRSHASRNDEVLVQDSTFTLHHIDGEGKVLWSKKLDGPIIGKIRQVDFFANGKLQFLFASPSKLHIIDRLGNYVSPFPISIRVPDIEFMSVVDYDNSKKYRFMVSDKAGRLWIYDKTGVNLEGWRPKNLDSNLFAEPRHHRIRGKDYMVAIRKDGWVYVMNRRGEVLKGFPLNIDARPEGDYYLESGNTLSTTNFVCVSRDGFRIKFNPEGKIQSKETLVKPSVNTVFSLIPEHQGKSYLIKRQDSKQLTMLNEEGKELFTSTFFGTNSVTIKYYDFGSGKVFISITDTTQDLSFVYDGKGKLITTTPIEGERIELRPGTGDLPRIFIVNKNTLTIQG